MSSKLAARATTILAATTVSTALVAAPAAAQTDPGNLPCITRTQWAKVDLGQTLATVKSEVGSGGYTSANSTLRTDRYWDGCSPYDNAYTFIRADFKRANTGAAWKVVYLTSGWTHN